MYNNLIYFNILGSVWIEHEAPQRPSAANNQGPDLSIIITFINFNFIIKLYFLTTFFFNHFCMSFYVE